MGLKKNNLKVFSFLLLIFLVLFIALDLLLARIFIRYSDRSVRIEHHYYHHGLIPNQKVIANWYNIRYNLFTNSLGFRDFDTRKIPLQTDKRRILIMGDSHSEGVGLNFSETFAGMLHTVVDTSHIEILNASAVSYSPRIHYLKTKYLLEETKLRFDEMIVVIDLSDLQNEIVYENYEPKEPGWRNQVKIKIYHWLVNRSFTFHTFAQLNQNRKTRAFLNKAEIFEEYSQQDEHKDALDMYATFFSGFDDKTLLSNPQFHSVGNWIYDETLWPLAEKGLKVGAENIKKLATLCHKHGIKLTISVHPWPEQIKLRQTENRYTQFWQEVAGENQIGFINLYPDFIYPSFSAAFGTDLFIPGDNHWNKNGNYIVAKRLAEYINTIEATK